MSDPSRAARYSDLFGADPGLEPEDGAQVQEPIRFPGVSHGHSHVRPSDCAYCPICTTIGVIRTTKPEVLEHLAAAGRELLAAASLLLEEASNLMASQPHPEDDERLAHQADPSGRYPKGCSEATAPAGRP